MIKILSCVQAAKANKQGKPYWWVSVEGQTEKAYSDKDLTASVGQQVEAEFKAIPKKDGSGNFYTLDFPKDKKGFGGGRPGMSSKQVALLSAALTMPNTATVDEVLKRAESFDTWLA